MATSRKRFSLLLRALVLFVLIAGIAISLLVMGLGSLMEDETEERQTLREAYKELENTRTK